MSNGKIDTPKDGVRSVYLALYFLGAVLSGAGGNYLWLRTTGPEVVAPDRFTGTEAARLENKLDTHIDTHPDRMLDIRITRLEAQYSIILRNQDRILDRLDKGP